MKKTEKAENIILGHGVFKVDGVDIGLTRDGGKFSVEYDNRIIEADGDRGPVKGRIIREKAQPKLEINHLELLSEFSKLHSGLKEDTISQSGYTVITGTGKIDDKKDYHNVEFNGETKDGREVSIKLENAINLENIDWELKDKNDIVDKVTYTACYEPNAADPFKEPFELKYKTAV